MALHKCVEQVAFVGGFLQKLLTLLTLTSGSILFIFSINYIAEYNM